MAAPEPLEQPSGDSAAVQLTRIEGKLDLLNFQISDVRTDVAGHAAQNAVRDERLGALELNVQRLGDAAVADKLTVEQTARALKDAKEATEAQARSETQKSNQMWTPFARMMAVVATLSTLAGLVAVYTR